MALGPLLSIQRGGVLVISLDIYRENPDKGAIPTFMINYGSESGCFLSFGLTMFKHDLPPMLSNNLTDALGMLKTVIEQSDFLADDKLLTGRSNDVQALDMGDFLYARAAINADTLTDFMLANDGLIRFQNNDSVIMFNLFGLEMTMNKLITTYCNY